MTESFFLGGYDAKTCVEKTRKNFHPAYAGVEQDPIPPGDQFWMDLGIAFEPIVGDLWKDALGARFFAVPECDRSPESKKQREELTLAKLANPGRTRVIWNARLPQLDESHQTGEPDALAYWGRSDDGTHLWVPVDVKKHRSLEGERQNSGTMVSELSDPHPGKASPRDIGRGTPRKADALQLAHYQRMLEALGHAAPVNKGAIIGDELFLVWHDLDAPVYRHVDLGTISALRYYDHEFAIRVATAEAALSGTSAAQPEWKSECASCVWRTTCHDELKVDLDHITLLPGITPKRAKAHYGAGVTRVADLTRLDWRTAKLIDEGFDVEGLRSWAASVEQGTPVSTWDGARNHAELIQAGVVTADDALKLHARTARYSGSKVWNLAGSIDQARVAKVGKVHRARGVASVSINRGAYEQDFDIEDCNGYVYLIGIRTSGRKKVGEDIKTRAEYVACVNWDQSVEGEARVFAEAWEHLMASRAYAKARRYGYRAYYYTHHEPSAFKALAARHAGRPGVPAVEEVAAYFDSNDVIDLYPILSTELVWPTESVTLKETAKWVRFSWRDTDPGGGNSLAWYKDATECTNEAVQAENRERLIEYNADDVHAQVAIRDWLSRLGEARQPGQKLPAVADLDSRFRPR
jgi:predicted flap endonuclease-1-like 5' DNA nuclease